MSLNEKNQTSNPTKPATPVQPSSFYSAAFWKFGLFAARNLPIGLTHRLCSALATLYVTFNSKRRRIVAANLRPVVVSDAAASKTSKQLFQQFAIKLVDLWRYESGAPIKDLFDQWTGWEHFEAARSKKRGILLLTPHLGNWEFGAPLLAERGVKLLVITLEEPDTRLTEIRKASRERWGIETLVLGRDTFAFIELIRRLENGETIALLMDRPPSHTAINIELFGKAFAASVSAAELARATGCVLLPAYIPRVGAKYAAHLLPPIEYDRATLRQHQARQKLTQEIMRAFEPAIRQHPDQWYHFVPIWPQ